MDNSWVDLKEKCPIDISMIESCYNELESYLAIDITLKNMGEAKQNISRARTNLNRMFRLVGHLLKDSDILKKPQDKILWMWMKENIKRFLSKLDEDEKNLITKFDSPNPETDRVGISRLSIYANKIRDAGLIIYDTLFHSTKDYSKLNEKDITAFLYIFFQTLESTMSMSPSVEEKGNLTKRNAINLFPSSYNALMGEKGGNIIRQGFEQDTGIKVSDFEENLGDLYDDFGDNE